MASFQFKPDAPVFVPRDMPTKDQTPAAPTTNRSRNFNHNRGGNFNPNRGGNFNPNRGRNFNPKRRRNNRGRNSNANRGRNLKPCQAVFYYHSCLCRKQIPTWICSRPQSQCTHKNISILVSSVPFACCSPMNVGARAVNQKQWPLLPGAVENCRTEACRAVDPANKQWVSDADAALALEKLHLIELDAFQGLSAEHFDQVVPAFLEEGKSWADEIRARYWALRISLGINDGEDKATTTATAPSPEGASATANSNQSDLEDSDEPCENSDSDSDPGVNSDSDDDEPITPPTNLRRLAILAGIFGSTSRPTSSTVITTSYESDNDSEYDSDDEDDDEPADEKKRKHSLRSLVEDSEPSLPTVSKERQAHASSSGDAYHLIK